MCRPSPITSTSAGLALATCDHQSESDEQANEEGESSRVGVDTSNSTHPALTLLDVLRTHLLNTTRALRLKATTTTGGTWQRWQKRRPQEPFRCLFWAIFEANLQQVSGVCSRPVEPDLFAGLAGSKAFACEEGQRSHTPWGSEAQTVAFPPSSSHWIVSGALLEGRRAGRVIHAQGQRMPDLG